MVEEEKVMACEAVNEDSEASTGMDGGARGGINGWDVCDGMSQPSSLHPLTNMWNHILADSST